MSILVNRKSYAETVEGRRRFLSRLKVVLIVFLAFQIVSGLFLSAYSVASGAMEPTLSPRDHILLTPLVYGPLTILGKLPAPVRPERGDIVLADPPYASRSGFFKGFLDSVVSFVTFQRFSLAGPGFGSALEGPFIERVIALPGDVVMMEDFVFKVRPSGQAHFLTEFELSSLRYDIGKPLLPEGWKAGLPLSGTMAPRSLGKDEYFLAGDNRGASSDSRLWGPVGSDRLRGKVFLRYWPFKGFGRP